MQSGEGTIRQAIIESELVDCMVALPDQLFYSTPIPACLWFLSRTRLRGPYRERLGQILFIDARKMGHMVDRTHRELSTSDIRRIADTYHAWRGQEEAGAYFDVPGFCKKCPLERGTRNHDHVLNPGLYVGIEPQEDDDEPFEGKIARLTGQWREQQAEGPPFGRRYRRQLQEV